MEEIEFTDEEYDDALNMASDIMDKFVNRDLNLCYAVLDMCIDALEQAEKNLMQEESKEKTFDWN